MKEYKVFMYNLGVDLSKKSMPSPGKYKYFEHEKETVCFAKSIQDDWFKVIVIRTEDDKKIITLRGSQK